MMSYPDLDSTIRSRMLAEYDAEQLLPDRYQSAALTERGRRAWLDEFREACRTGDDRSLLLAMDRDAFWVATPTGKACPLAWRRRTCVSEFNTFYVRALAGQLLDEGVEECVVFRADAAAHPDTCSGLEGLVLDPQHVYDNHRRRYHPRPEPTIVTVPYQPGCHHSIRRVG